MTPPPPLWLWLRLALPVAAAAAALYQLAPVLDRIAHAFATELDGAQRLSAGALLVAVVFFFGAAFAGESDGDSRSSKSSATKSSATMIDYPLALVAAATTDAARFQCLFPVLKAQILHHVRTAHELDAEAVAHVDGMVEYSVPGGKLNRGTTVLAVYRSLLGGQRPLTVVEICRAAAAGWAIEFLQAFFLVADDVMDDSQLRRGQPCWYKLPHVGLVAINDAFLLESFVYTILRLHFGGEDCYPHLLELVIDVTQKTEVGQLLDLTSQRPGQKIDLARFTPDRYRAIVKYKTAYYSFYLPVAMGMRLARIPDARAYAQAQSICCRLGEYFQIQDDYLDCFGDPAVTGKVGTDIQDNKCSWLVVQALRTSGPAQRVILEQNYGSWDNDKVGHVKDLYRALGLVEAFAAYEDESYRQIQAELQDVTLVPREVYELFLDKIYKRSK